MAKVERNKDEKTKTSISLTVKELEKFQAHASAMGSDLSKMIRALMLEDIADHEETNKDGSDAAVLKRIRKLRTRLKLLNDDRMGNLPIDDLLDL